MFSRLFGSRSKTDINPADIDRRVATRVQVAKGTAVIEGVSYPIMDISVTGFRVGAYNGKLRDGIGFQVRLIMPFGGQIVGINAQATVQRLITTSGLMAASFSSLSTEAQDKIQRYVTSRSA